MTPTELEQTLDRELSFVHEKARTPGGWAEVQARYQITAPLPKAAPSAQQLRMVVNGLVLQCAQALEQAGDRSEAAHALWLRLCRTVDEEGRAHQEWLGPQKPRSKLLGNIMANATASVNEEFWTAFKWNARVVALCKTCGAPQQTPRDYKCGYCGGDIFRGMEFPNE